MRFYIQCSVWGGVTGTRTAPLKEHGAVKLFETRDAAEAEASRLRSTMGRLSPASFQYVVEEHVDQVPS